MPLDSDPDDIRLEATQLQDQTEERPRSGAPVQRVQLTRVQEWQGIVRRFWNRQVVLTVSHEQCRDHFGEQTERRDLPEYPAYLFCVVVAQLFRLQSQSAAADNFGSYILGIPLAVISAGMAICVTLLGAVRFYRQQHAMSRGKIHVGGWDLNVVGCGTLTVILVVFVLVLAIDIDKGSI
ncbi:MAG: hypothetical protein MMC33_002400 [Icmadophila ericetorum]|nr:hypothetical protein [Icmadophila ericetorum]